MYHNIWYQHATLVISNLNSSYPNKCFTNYILGFVLVILNTYFNINKFSLKSEFK